MEKKGKWKRKKRGRDLEMIKPDRVGKERWREERIVGEKRRKSVFKEEGES